MYILWAKIRKCIPMTYEPFLLQSFSKKFSFDHSALKEPKKKKKIDFSNFSPFGFGIKWYNEQLLVRNQ